MVNQDKRNKILHIVANYPDEVFQQPTTDAVKNLLDATASNFDHFIISIFRTLNPRNEFVVRNKDKISISYFGLPGAIGQRYFMERLANRIEKELISFGQDFDVIHGHKLTVETLVAYFLHKKFDKPYVCTLRGDTDGKLLAWRPDYRMLYSSILENASEVFLVAPWSRNLVKRYLMPAKRSWRQNTRFVLLPNIVRFFEEENSIRKPGEVRFVTVFRERQGKRKGFLQLLKAMDFANEKQKVFFLDVIGCGPNCNESKLVNKMGLSDQVRFLGKFDNLETVRRMAQYRGFVLPTRKDTFGMVYVEALFSGVPIMYSSGTGIDGYLNDLDVGIRIDPYNQESINNGLLELDLQASYLRDRLKLSLKEGKLDFFRRSSIASIYTKTIKCCIQ